MFKVQELKLRNHSVLKNLDMRFINQGEENNGPYTSVIIGPNGSGKSYILKELINIFREIEQKSKGKNPRYSDGFYLLRFYCNEKEYLVTNGSGYFREDFPDTKISVLINGDPDEIKNLTLPSNVIASSIMLNDRFPFLNSAKTSFYQYSGIRRTAGTTSTKTPSRKTISAVIENLDTKDFKNDIIELTKFLGYDEGISFNYKPRYYSKIFMGNIYPEKLHSIFGRKVADSEKGYVIWGVDHYKKIREERALIERICNYLNRIAKQNIINVPPRSKLIRFNPSEDKDFIKNFDLIEHLSSLNLIESPSISVNKNKGGFKIEDASSGEIHFILSYLTLFAKIKENSLIFIDEPEISLHPNWQMQYIDFLKMIFSKYASCHFIIATHSHFLISDLKGETSSTIWIKKEKDKIEADLIEADTYAWSAEDILYDIFRVKISRNYFIENKLRELLSKISYESTEYERIWKILAELQELKLKEDDPINHIIKKAVEYVND